MPSETLTRFVTAQEDIYKSALRELKNGRKKTHWMWFIFPQMDGLGHSGMAEKYAIRSREEAEAYLQHPLLGQRLIECSNALLQIDGKTASEIMGFPDDLKLHSSMTLFSIVSNESSVFHQVIDKYFQGQADQKTLDLLQAS